MRSQNQKVQTASIDTSLMLFAAWNDYLSIRRIQFMAVCTITVEFSLIVICFTTIEMYDMYQRSKRWSGDARSVTVEAPIRNIAQHAPDIRVSAS